MSKDILGLTCGGYSKDDFTFNLALLQTLHQQAKFRDAKLTPEERKERDRVYDEIKEKQRIDHFVRRGLCPDCGGRLTRGKKDKHNDYKRECTCTNCNSKWYR